MPGTDALTFRSEPFLARWNNARNKAPFPFAPRDPWMNIDAFSVAPWPVFVTRAQGFSMTTGGGPGRSAPSRTCIRSRCRGGRPAIVPSVAPCAVGLAGLRGLSGPIPETAGPVMADMAPAAQSVIAEAQQRALSTGAGFRLVAPRPLMRLVRKSMAR